jgi:hypothetical protein
MREGIGRLIVGVVSLGAAATLVGCTASGSTAVHGTTVSRSVIEQSASKQIADRFGAGRYTVTCPHDLAAKTGATMTCVTRFPDGEKFSGTARVTSVGNGTAHWKYTPSTEPAR